MISKLHIQPKKTIFAFVLILCLAIILRFYRLPSLFYFGGDEEYQVYLALPIIRDFHIIWIGVNAANTGFFLGPFWTYFTAFWLLLSNKDPMILAYIAAAIGVATTILITLTARKFFGKTAGFLSGLLHASLPLVVYFDQKYWNPTPIPFLTILMFLSLVSVLKNKQPRADSPRFSRSLNKAWWVIFFAAFGLVFHTHLSLIPIGLLGFFYFLKNKAYLSKKTLVLSLIAFIIVLSPLIAFDYFKKGLNITTPFRFTQITEDPTNKINPIHHAQSLFETLGRIWYLAPNRSNTDELLFSCTSTSIFQSPTEVDTISTRTRPALLVSFISLVLILFFIFRKTTWTNEPERILAFFVVTLLNSFIFYPGRPYEYYLLGLFPLIILIFASLISHSTGTLKNVGIVAVIVMAILGMRTVLTATDEFSLIKKKVLISEVAKVIKNEPFDITQKGLCHAYEGWRYLFIIYGGIRPERSATDVSLGWLYPDEISNKPTKYSVILSEVRVPLETKIGNAKVITSGGFSAYILQNY